MKFKQYNNCFLNRTTGRTGCFFFFCILSLVFHGACTSRSVHPAPGPASGVLDPGGYSFAFLEWRGEGPPIIFLHGLGGNALVFGGLAEDLGHRNMIAIDLPGHGLTPAPRRPEEWALDAIDRALVRAVRARWPGSHIWAGHSWGGKLAIGGATMDGDSTVGLMLFDPTPTGPVSNEDPEGSIDSYFKIEFGPHRNLDEAISTVNTLPQYSPWSANLEQQYRRSIHLAPDGSVTSILTRESALAVVESTSQDYNEMATSIHSPVLLLLASETPQEPHQESDTFEATQLVEIESNHWILSNNRPAVAFAVRRWLSHF